MHVCAHSSLHLECFACICVSSVVILWVARTSFRAALRHTLRCWRPCVHQVPIRGRILLPLGWGQGYFITRAGTTRAAALSPADLLAKRKPRLTLQTFIFYFCNARGWGRGGGVRGSLFTWKTPRRSEEVGGRGKRVGWVGGRSGGKGAIFCFWGRNLPPRAMQQKTKATEWQIQSHKWQQGKPPLLGLLYA